MQHYYEQFKKFYIGLLNIWTCRDSRVLQGVQLTFRRRYSIHTRAVETHFKKPRFLGFLKKPKKPEKLGF